MAKDAKRFVYKGGERTVEDVTRFSKQSGGTYDSFINPDIPTYKPREGDCAIRILPMTWEDTEKWGPGWHIGVTVHYGVGPDEGTYLCLDKMKGEPCPVCEARRDAVDADEADALRTSWRALCWVVDRDNEKAGPMVWSMPISVFRDINVRSVDKRTKGVILIDDPDEGYDVLFSRAGSGVRTKYTSIEVERDPTPILADQKRQQKWEDFILDNPLPDLLNFFEYEYIEKVLFGKVDKRRAAAEEEEHPRRGRRATEEDEERPSGRRRSRGAEEEEEDRPTGRRRASEEEERPVERRRSRAESDEEEEPTRRRRPAEPDEEEERPASRRRAASETVDEEGEEERPTRRRAAQPEAEEEVGEDDPPPRRRRAAPAEDEVGDDAPRRRRAAAKEEDDDPPSEDAEPTATARRQLDKLRNRRK